MWWPFGFLNVHGIGYQALWVVANIANNYKACTNTCHEHVFGCAFFPFTASYLYGKTAAASNLLFVLSIARAIDHDLQNLTAIFCEC